MRIANARRHELQSVTLSALVPPPQRAAAGDLAGSANAARDKPQAEKLVYQRLHLGGTQPGRFRAPDLAPRAAAPAALTLLEDGS